MSLTMNAPPADGDGAILDAIDRFVERSILPVAHDLEARDEYPHGIVEEMKDLGLFGATIAPEYGGLGLSAVTYSAIIERISAGWMSISGIVNSHLIMAAAVQRFGTDQQKARFLAEIRDRRTARRHCLDRAGLRHGSPGRAHPRRAPGQRLYRQRHQDLDHQQRRGRYPRRAGQDRSGGRTAPPRHEPAAGRAGRGRRDEQAQQAGLSRASDTGEVVLDRCQVPFDNLVGGEEGHGLQQILAGLELGRINVAARGVGIARVCLEKAVEYAQLRKTFGKPIAEHQAIQIKLADMATRVEAARLLTSAAAEAYDRGRRCDMEAGMAKLFATEAAVENSLEAMRIHGAYGYSKEFDIERYYRDAPLLAIGEGTNELQRLIIAKQLIARNPV